MAKSLASVWSCCKPEEQTFTCCKAEPQTLPGSEIDKMLRERLVSEEQREMRLRRINPSVQPVEANTLYNRRRGSGDLAENNLGDELLELPLLEEDATVSLTVTSYSSSASPGSSTPDRHYAL
jgi:hypothetical protein